MPVPVQTRGEAMIHFDPERLQVLLRHGGRASKEKVEPTNYVNNFRARTKQFQKIIYTSLLIAGCFQNETSAISVSSQR